MRARIVGAKAALAAVLVGGLAVPALSAAAHAAAPPGAGFTVHHGAAGETDMNVCSTAVPKGVAHCNARVRTDRSVTPNVARPFAAPSGHAGGPYDPSFLQSAYNAPVTRGAGVTVAIVDAYDNPKAESDLAIYRSVYGLPPCTTANGCFRKVDQNGGTVYPPGNSGWGLEIALDLDMVSAMCPKCNILLVEANNALETNLGAGVNTAVALGASAVSNSYGGGEYSSEQQTADAYYNHPGVAITVSSGDSGYGVEFPASAPGVIAVGGTTLNQTTNNGTRNATETAWSGAGSGCSKYVAKPSWQTDNGCSKRTSTDVSADANPATGAIVYDTFGEGGYLQVGGTSESAPIIAGLMALAAPVAPHPASFLYAHSAQFNDVTQGSNGSCGGSYLCAAGSGYDGPTGLGTPSGVGGLGTGAATPKGFDTTVAPSNATIDVDTSTSGTVSIAPTGGFTGAVSMSAAVSPNTGLSAHLTSSSVNVGPGTGSTSLNLAATVPGTYTVTVTATSGATTHQATIDVLVTGPDFALKGPTKPRKARAGKKTTVRVSVKPIDSFTGAVTFTLRGLPSGDIYTMSKPEVDGKGSESFTVTTSVNNPLGVPFPLTITATSGLIVRTLTLTLTLK